VKAGLGVVIVTIAAVVTLAGCGSSAPSSQSTQTPPAEPVWLSAPNTDIIVAIPTGWHQVIDSANPAIGEMVAPLTCIGNAEVACSTGVARIASVLAPTAQAAEATVEQAVVSAPGVSRGATITQGPGVVGARQGYRHKFSFHNPKATLTAEIAAAASGPDTQDPLGNREFSIVLVWVSNQPNAPSPAVIDYIIGSAKFAGGIAPTK
jgi:hypothetical protein